MHSPGHDWIIIISTVILYFLVMMAPLPGRSSATGLDRNDWVSKRQRSWQHQDSSYYRCCQQQKESSVPHSSLITGANIYESKRKNESRKSHRRRFRAAQKSDKFGESHASSSHSHHKEKMGKASKVVSNQTPEFVFVQPIVVVQPHSLATLPCSIKNLGDRQVVWRQIATDEFLTIGQMVWSKDPRITVDYQQRKGGITSWDLLIKAVDPADAGMYECQITTSEKIVMNVELRMSEMATTTSKPKTRSLKEVTQRAYVNTDMKVADQQSRGTKEESLTAGQSITLTCNVSLEKLVVPGISIYWAKDGKRLRSNHHVLLTSYKLETAKSQVNELRIENSNVADSGEYACHLDKIILKTAMIYVLPNTTIGSDTKDNHEKYYTIGSLTVENGASSALVSHNRFTCNLITFILVLLVLCNLADNGTIKQYDQI